MLTLHPVARHRTGPLGLAAAVLVLGLAAPGEAPAGDEIRLQASVDRTRVEVGEVVTLTVSVSSEGAGVGSTPDLGTPDGFDLVGSTSSTSTSISIVNGAMTATRTTSYVFSLRALQVGSFVIGPVELIHEGRTYRSSPIRVEVVAASGKRQTRPAPAPGQSLSGRDLREMEENLFLKAESDRRTAYVGEQVTVSYKLYTRYNIQNVRYGHLPTFTGFWAETLHDAQRLDLRPEAVDGRTFNAALLKRVALFPTAPGKQSLEQLEIVCEIPVRSRRRSLFDFDDFFDADPFGRAQQVTVRSDVPELEILPLPPGAPAGFHGAVGRFEISAAATPTQVTAGDPVSLRVVVSGTGNINGVPEAGRPSTDAIRFYDPKVSVTTDRRGDRVGGRKTFEYVVIPEKAGEVEIPPFELISFDPEGKRYATAKTPSIGLSVRPGARVAQPAAAPLLSREEVKALGEDIRHIKPDAVHLDDQGGALYRNWLFLVLQGVPVVGFLGAFVYRRHRERLVGDVAYARRRRSRSEARQRLSQARRLMGAGESGAFYSEIYRSLAQFVADRVNVSAAGMTADEAVTALTRRGVPRGVVSQVREVFGQCDFARFASSKVVHEEMENLYRTTESLIHELGRRV